MRNEFYKDTQGALLVYDVGERESFEALELWLNELRQEIGNQVEVDNIVFAVCANKVATNDSRVHTCIPLNLNVYREVKSLKR